MKCTATYLLAILLACPFVSSAQDEEKDTDLTTQVTDTTAKDTTWKKGGVLNINFNQVSLTNWAAGGKSSVAFSGLFSYFANLKKGRHTWDNNVDLAYGRLIQDGGDDSKTDDRLEFASKYGYEIKGPWYASYLLSFKTQFDEGFDPVLDSLKISEFMSPAYVITGPGIDYKPKENISVFFSPVEYKATIVLDQDLADVGQFGVDAAEFDDLGNKTKNGQNLRSEFGAYIKIWYTEELMKNVTFMTKLDLFSNYLDRPENIDVTWETLFTLKVNEWLSASLNTLLIYDHDIGIIQETGDADNPVKVGPATQFKQTFGAGLSLKI